MRPTNDSLIGALDACRGRRAFTLLEMTVAIAIVGLLLAILLPAIGAAREAARRAECQSHLKQIGEASHAFEAQRGYFPTAGAFYYLLPYIDQAPLYDELERRPRDPDWDVEWAPAMPHVIPLYLCPTDPAPVLNGPGPEAVAGTNYGGNVGTGYQKYGDNGLWIEDKPGFKISDVRDGLSQTAYFAEILRGQVGPHRLRSIWQMPRMLTAPDELEEFADSCEQLPVAPWKFGYSGGEGERGFPWFLGVQPMGHYNHVLPPNRPNCLNGTNYSTGAMAAGSMHGGGAHVLFADGHVEFISEAIDRAAWRELGSRAPLEQL